MLTCVESLPLIQAPILAQESWLTHGFGIKDIPIQHYLNELGLTNAALPDTKQIHGKTVHLLKSGKSFNSKLEGDAFITDEPGVICWVRSADCVPILLADRTHHVIGAIHSGWRGTAEKIILEVLSQMEKKWQTSPEDLTIAIGPAIGGHCYQIGADVQQVFEQARLYPVLWMEEAWAGRWYLDLAFANLELLAEAGVPREQIYLSLACTACDLDKFHSYRKEGGKKGEQVSFIVKR
ncbi:MAG: peptidoglycan editing factor PgeF [Deltaproteobacteria bacterium]|nr:peptidoglycan editing factor PgeF [Deltaproteobacteria bacterium]